MKDSYFFIGVAGSGMSAIAQYLSGKGYAVYGSDRQFFSDEKPLIQKQLEDASVKCFKNDGSGIFKELSFVVVSTAIEESNIDLVRAKELGIKVLHRSEMLAKISAETRSIAVSGTSGKSTVTGMIYHILNECGFSPSIITGAGLVSLEKEGKIGNAVAGTGEWLVMEADESDGSLVRYHPEIGVILNIDKDHKEISELQKIFDVFAKNIEQDGKTLFVNGNNPLASAYAKGREFLFGTENSFGTQGVDFTTEGTHIRFRVRNGGALVRCTVPLPGKHNMENALAAIAVTVKAGVPLREAALALASFPGIHRRHQILGTFNGVTLVDDFAHNPAKIAASILSVQAFTTGRVFAWFQPHGFGPTRFLRNDLVKSIESSLRKNDKMFFSDIYYAGGTVTRDISAGDLSCDLKTLGVDSVYIADRDNCAKEMALIAKTGDTILLMGARDPTLSAFAESVALLLKSKSCEKPL